MPSSSPSFLQTVVASGQGLPPQTRPSSPAPASVSVYLSLEILDDPSVSLLLSDGNLFGEQQVRTLQHGRTYQIRIAASSQRSSQPDLRQQRLQVRSPLELMLVCTEASVIIEQARYVISPAESADFEQTLTIALLQECPTGLVRFGLLGGESGARHLIAALEVMLEGTYNPPDEAFGRRTGVELDSSLPEDTAILHILAQSSETLSMRGWSHRHTPLETRIQAWEPLKPAEFMARGLSPEHIIHAVRRFSRTAAGELLLWLKRLLGTYGQRLCLIIADHTTLETPWEMLEIEDEAYLGALAIIVRWTSIRFFAENTLLKIGQVHTQGSVLAYLDDRELGARQTYRERDALLRLKRQDCQNVQEFKQRLRQLTPEHNVGLIYLGCHGYEGETLGSLRSPAQRLTRLDLEIPRVHPEPRPIVFVNACESARLKRDGPDSFSGLLEVLLARYASAYIGTLGPVGSTYASQVAEYVLLQARSPQGVQIADVLRQLRAEAVSECLATVLDGMSETERQKREERFLYAFMYVYYGNALVQLQLLDAEERQAEP